MSSSTILFQKNPAALHLHRLHELTTSLNELRTHIHADLGGWSSRKRRKELDLALFAFREEHGEFTERLILIETPEWVGLFINETGTTDCCIVLRLGFPTEGTVGIEMA